MSIIIAATGTNIGKTMISSAIIAKYGVSHSIRYWKPIQTGESYDHDRSRLEELSGGSDNLLPNFYEFSYPASPELSARLEGKSINYYRLISQSEDYLIQCEKESFQLIVELAGGVLVPINERFQNIHFIQNLNLPVLVVVSMSLGTINHTLLTWESLAARNIPVIGFVGWNLGEYDPIIWKDSATAIERITNRKLLGAYHHRKVLNSEEFLKWAKTEFDRDESILRLIT